MMVLNEKDVLIKGTVPIVTMAVYTTYKITMASINLRRKRKLDRILFREIRTINFIDALVSILSLQNTMIVVYSTSEINAMLVFSSFSSAILLMLIIFVTVYSFVKDIKITK